MKSSKILALSTLLITVLANLTITSVQANTFNKSTINKAGRVVTPAINTLLSGKGAPKSTIGIDGDFYIDTNKMSAPGAPGATGPAGSGSPGATGAAGVAGSNGASGSNGTNGTNGAPGSIGETGPKGENGTIGLTGPAGSISPSMGLLTFTTMIGNSTSTSSKDFGTFALGKNYIVQLLLHGVSETGASKLIKFAVSSPDALVVLTSDYVVLNGYTSRSGFREQESSIVATVLVNGSNTTTNYFLTATITLNETAVSPGLLFSGSFSGIQVGSIT
jgi:hypothetical protein